MIQMNINKLFANTFIWCCIFIIWTNYEVECLIVFSDTFLCYSEYTFVKVIINFIGTQ